MDDGINLLCPDGQRRLCFPVLAEYLADYEEQRLLASILSGRCPKCTIPAYRPPPQPQASVPLEQLNSDDAVTTIRQLQSTIAHLQAQIKSQRKRKRNSGKAPRSNTHYATTIDDDDASNPFEDHPNHTVRDAYDAKYIRETFRDNPLELKKRGYHHTRPFTERHIHSDIYESLAPDLLHQVDKCFYDYVHGWIISAIAAESHVSVDKAKGEIDARFSNLPPYPKLRAFRHGISSTTRWTGNEYKNMLRVYLGVVRSLLSEDSTRLVRLYLDIHRLSHYTSHTDSTVRMLEDAVSEFTRLRNDPQGPLRSLGIIARNWYCPKIHYFQHYAQWISKKGALPYCSTDRSEAWHQPIKASFRASNKGPQAVEFILRDDDRRLSWMVWEAGLGGDQIPTVEDEDQAASEPDDHAEKPTDMEKLGESVDFCTPRRWPGSREMSVVEEEENLTDFVAQSMRCLRWIHDGRRANARRRGEDLDINERGRIEIYGYLALRICYPTVHDREVMIKEVIRSTQSWSYGQNTDWKKSRFDTVLIRYQAIEGGHQMASRWVARVLLFFRVLLVIRCTNSHMFSCFKLSCKTNQAGCTRLGRRLDLTS